MLKQCFLILKFNTKMKKIIFGALCLLALTSCATMFGDKQQYVAIST